MRQLTLMKKLLFSDIDGTLVDFGNSTMSPSTADALINAKQNGHMIFLCKGRSYNQIYPSLKAFDFDGVVAAAGGYVTAVSYTHLDVYKRQLYTLTTIFNYCRTY